MKMRIVSSHRPHSQSAEFRANQIRAKESWDSVACDVFYLGDPEPELDGPHTKFIPCQQHPTIRQLAKICSEVSTGNGFAALVNSDIMLHPARTIEAIGELAARNAKCAISLRYQYENGAQAWTGDRTDLGIDFFLAKRGLWQMVEHEIPEMFRIGHILYDTWLMSFFSRWGGRDAYDITDQKIVFHPIHGDRKRIHPVHDPRDHYTTHISWPKGRLRMAGVIHPSLTHAYNAAIH